jgi:hypothetical protein
MTTVVAMTVCLAGAQGIKEDASCNESERLKRRLIQLLGHNARFNRSFLAKRTLQSIDMMDEAGAAAGTVSMPARVHASMYSAMVVGSGAAKPSSRNPAT